MSEAQATLLAGLRLRPAAGAPAFRIARTSYGPINPPERRIIHGIDVRTGETRRTLSAPLSDWNRWDTIGRTFYLADSLEAAYAEALAPFRRRTGDGSDPLEADAAAIGLTLEEFIALVEADCGECSFMRTGNLPASWRHARAVYTLHMPTVGSWIDIGHGDTLAALDAALGPQLSDLGYENGLTVADVLSDDRQLTTRIAAALRGLVFADGSEPLGIAYPSKRGYGTCWAYWMRRLDLGLATGAHDPRPTRAVPITERDPTLVRVSGVYGIRVH
ncbi:MAG TPA: hypothetical protein VFE45_13565 [Coriobacteriia bacterium]|nr:hypothetical protein [Coriobacteriia bacterium]